MVPVTRCGDWVAPGCYVEEPFRVWCNSSMAKTKRPPTFNAPGEALAKIEAFGGVEALEEMIARGVSYSDICESVGISIVSLIQWVAADPSRSSRIREARRISAFVWDERAAERIESAEDGFNLQKAAQLAHHYRWRSKCAAPKDYGDRVQQEVTGKDGGPIQSETKVTAQKVVAELLKGLELQRQAKKSGVK